jgi:hypothetical protein
MQELKAREEAGRNEFDKAIEDTYSVARGDAIR